MTMTDRPISDSQASFIHTLLADRIVTLGFPTVDDAATALKLSAMDMSDASTIIGRLKAMPKDPDLTMPAVVASASRSGKGNRPGRCASCGHNVEADTGFYYLDRTSRWAVHHKVGECDTTPAPAKVEVAIGYYQCGDKIVQAYRTGTGRIAGKIMSNRTGTFNYVQGATKLIENGGVLLSGEELAEAICMALYGVPLGSEALREMAVKFGVDHGNCMFCRKDLTDERSNPALGGVGYGKICAAKYGLPWGVKS